MAVLYPRVYLLTSLGQIPCISASVTKKAKRAADTFTAELSILRTTLFGADFDYWADYQPEDVQIMMATALGEADITSMITGRIDKPQINWEQNTVSVSGRDKSASLIETRRSQKFSSQKSSDIASTIASDNGLSPQVTSTSDYAGKQYNDGDVNHLALHRTDFEIMSDLADREGFRWYVSGTSLVFEPKGQGSDVYSAMWCPPGTVAPYGVATITGLETSRNMTAAKTHNVNVKSWHPKDGKMYVGQAQAQGVGDTINIDHHHNGKTQDQADTLAMSRAMDAIRHDCNVTAKGPLDLTVDPRQMQLQLSGTGTIYDQLYDMDDAKFDISWTSAEMELKCKSANGRTVSQGGSSDGADSAAGDNGDST